jgi:hypothetical protein
MADPNDTKSGGLAKQLMFPGFADAGASTTYRVGDTGGSSSSSEASTVVQNNLSEVDEDPFEIPISSVGNVSNVSEGDYSDASTHIQNNLSGMEKSKLAKPEPASTSAKTAVTKQTRSTSFDSVNASSPPSFFSSTNPAVANQSPPLGPESPPKLPRRILPPNSRNSSTVADAGSGRNTPTESLLKDRKNPLLAVNDPGWDDKLVFGFLNPSEEKRDEALTMTTPPPVSFRSVPSSTFTNTGQHVPLKQDEVSTMTTPPPVSIQSVPSSTFTNTGQHVPVKQDEASTLTTPPPVSVQSVPSSTFTNTGQHVPLKLQVLSEEAKLDHDKAKADGIWIEDLPVQIMGEPIWEEEATPAQTAFGKELMFKRKERQALDGSSDVLSTASEMGTIVGTGQRMMDLEDMEAEDFSSSSPLRPTLAAEDYSRIVWGNEDISLPILESGTKKVLERDAGISDEKKVSDIEENPGGADSDSEAAPKGNPKGTATNMLSMAIRRIGSGITGGATNQRGTVSAPSTPRAVAASPTKRPLQRTPRSSEETSATPQSFLLRSPGSSAHLAAKSSDSKRFALSPRFSIWKRDISPKQKDRSISFAGIPEDEITARIPEDETTKDRALSKQTIPFPFQIARSCLSFDAYDTSMDDKYEFTLPDIEARELRESLENSQRWLPTARPHNVESVLRNSKSWDVSGASQTASAFRPARHVRDRSRVGPPETKRQPFGSPAKDSGRVRIMSDFSPAVNKDMAMELRIPQRIEIEREDALDILSCLVERGASLHEVEAEGEGAEHSEGPKTRPFGSLDVSSVADDLRALSKTGKSKDSSAGIESDHAVRMLVLDELLRSHEYALEMSRAAQSASSWLTSIGRPLATKSDTRKDSASGVMDPTTKDVRGAQTAGETASESIDLLMAKAMLHTAQMEAKEKSEQAARLNEELAKCRAEIGRLKTAPNLVPFKSPNRSILDETNDDDEDDDDESEVEDGVIDRSFENASPIGGDGESGFIHSSFLFAPDPIAPNEKEDDQASVRNALDEANEIIRKLHSELKASNQADSVPEEPPIVQVDSHNRQSESPGNKDERTVNVRMLDGENFVTDWDDLAPPLPPPPDHGLRSPIVAAVLEQWTSESSLHESLLAWIDQVLAGGDPEYTPPLTISSLDHQVRDGFSMHVLPLLLRRPDIRVDVQTRAHRSTVYDIAVGVQRISPHQPFDVRRHLETTSGRSDIGGTSVTHSTTTALISNGTITIPSAKTFPDFADGYESRGGVTSGLSYDEMAEGMNTVDHQAPGIMSALGGALGGLLTRRKPVLDNVSEVGSMAAMHDSPAAGSAQEFGVTSDGQDDDQPYHRVVSAPPGRIGVTFVEYRGHAMVSDVAPDSPLGGWIFPSDILIAIDELPVSGMRVRDIITVLKDRKDRQRALRVISSHAMNEFTLNSSVVADMSTS